MWKLKVAEGGGGGEWVTTTNNHVGRQYWEFDAAAGSVEEQAEVERMREEYTKNKFQYRQSADLLMRMQLLKENSHGPVPASIKINETEEITEEAITTTLRRAISFYSSIQAHDGHWPTESAGPFLSLSPMVIVLYVTGAINAVLSPEHKKEIIRYLRNHQNEDGGWGLHILGHSTVYGSVLNYIALRLLGEGPEDDAVARGRKWILDHGGAIGTPLWGKLWLAVLGVYEWDGCNPLPPELWLLPKFFPIHPGKMMCFFRLPLMPMSYLYGKRFVGPITSMTRALRQEIYNEPYHEIHWDTARNTCAKEDLYYPHTSAQDMLWGFLHHFAEPMLKRWPFSKLRDKALDIAIEHVHYEDKNSKYLCAGCGMKESCLLACWVEDPNSEAFKRHLARIPDYLWIAEDGMKIQSFGSQMWDVAFAIQAVLSANLSQEYTKTLRKAHNFVKASQVRDNPSGDFRKMYRHECKGAWPFSMQDQGWQVSDCTAEGLKVALLLSQMPSQLVGEPVESEHLYDAVNVILSLQSKNGGFPAWEPLRAQRWLEKLNPTEMFEDVVIEREYVEITSSAIQSLVLFQKIHPGHRHQEIERCLSRAVHYIENTQECDGSWYGCWGICYTYGTWFGVEGLVASGKNYHNSLALRNACKFLLSKQLPDGGWGESYLSCSKKMYINLDGNKSNLVQTSWALLSLIDAGQAEIDPLPIHRGIKLLINSHMENGDFPQQDITGIFMRNCTLNYSSYRNIFPLWALGEYHRRVLQP